MKNKILIILIGIIGFSFKNSGKIVSIGLVTTIIKCNAQGFAPSVNADGSYTIFKVLSPTNTYGNRWDVLKITTDSIIFRSPKIVFDSLIHSSSIGGSNQMISVNPVTRMLTTTTFSLLTFPYANLTGTPTIISAITASTGISITSGSTIVNSLPDRTVTIVSTNTNITVSGSYPTFSVTYVPTTRTSTVITRSIVTSTTSTGFQLSTTLDYNVSYSVYAQVSSALAGTNTGDIYLETSPNNAAPWTTINRSGVSVAGVLSTTGGTQSMSGFIPSGYYVRIRSAATGSNSGSAVFTYQTGQENSY